MPVDRGLFARTLQRLGHREGVLAHELIGFAAWLEGQGYTLTSQYCMVLYIHRLSCYLAGLGLTDPAGVTPKRCARFLASVPHANGISSSVDAYLVYKGMDRLCGLTAPAPSSPHQAILDEYLCWAQRCGQLAPRTARNYASTLTPFLKSLGRNATPLGLARTTPETVYGFFRRYGKTRPPSMQWLMQRVLRSFLRFCWARRYTNADLSNIIVPARRYRLSRLPLSLDSEGIRSFLQSFDRATPGGCRDYAIVMLLAVYGVRSIQVRELRIDDVLWRQSQVRFPAAKGGNEVLQPLTREVGDSLLAYLQRVRPIRARRRELFLALTAPYRPLTASAVSVMVRSRLEHAGISVPPGSSRGSHIFRHAFASRLVNASIPLKTVADMLGHRAIDSTLIYTKVNDTMLCQVPLNWPPT